jgi:LuxR family transcriptional regulator, maltose regulon positive regulatory protein
MALSREPLGSARGPNRSLRQVLPEALHDGSELLDSAADGGGHEHIEQPILVATKLRPPPVREQSIPRERLLERLRSGSDRRLTLVACPAGFGKTSLLSAWYEAEAARRLVAWLTLDEGDNDPVVLWSHAIGALRRANPDVATSASVSSVVAPVIDLVLPRLVNELDGQDEITLIVDDFHRVSSEAARASVRWFIEHAPPGFHLVLASRTEPNLPVASLRAHGELLELRADDLRFTYEEADEFLNGRLGLDLTAEDVDSLVRKTEGWPAGLYLAALSLQPNADRHAFVRTFGGSNRHVVDFLVTEVLEAHDPSAQVLMLRTSILDRLTGPLCDAVMEYEGSAAMLDALSRTNLFLVPLDDEAGSYRFHPIFAQLLRVELERREPGLARALHRRAYCWHRDHGTPDEAIQHAVTAEDYAEAVELIETVWIRYANTWRYDTVLAWLRQLPDEVVASEVHLLLIQAWVLSLSARQEEAAQAIAAIDRLGDLDVGPLRDGFSSAQASMTMLRASFPWGDVGAQLEHARRVVELEGPGSPWRPLACWAFGVGLYFEGERDEADEWLAEAAALAPANAQWLSGTSSLAYRSLIAGERGRVDEQRTLAESAAQFGREHGTEEAVGTVPLAVGASLAARGRPEEALALIEHGVALARIFGQPVQVAHALLGQAKVLGALGEHKAATAAIADARSILEQCPDPGILAETLSTLARPGQIRRAPCEDLELTPRELGVLKLLRSDLSERDIGRELYVSYYTVHSHVRSIYRKLAVRSRADALERSRELHLL